MVMTSTILGPADNTAIKIRVNSDGAGAGTAIIANTDILAALPAGPLKDIFNATYADQQSARDMLCSGGSLTGPGNYICTYSITPLGTTVTTWCVDVVLNAGKPELHVTTQALSAMAIVVVQVNTYSSANSETVA